MDKKKLEEIKEQNEMCKKRGFTQARISVADLDELLDELDGPKKSRRKKKSQEDDTAKFKIEE